MTDQYDPPHPVHGKVAELSAMSFGPIGESATPVTEETPLPVAASPSSDQDPIFDHEAGTKTTVTASSVTVLTPPAGCKYARFSGNGDFFVRTDGEDAADAAGSVRLIANQPEVLPVVAGVATNAYAAASTVVRVVPLKAR